MNFYVYLVLALGCFVGELFTMEFSLTCVGIGLLGAAAVSWLGTSLWVQVAVFSVVAVACWLGIRPLALKHLYGKVKEMKTPSEDVLGKQAVVEVAIDPAQGTGRVLVNGESWKATADKPLAKGTPCTVEKLNGVTLFVKQK
ncbi:MAG: NfeD family protein [Elusimicrobiaceae bacterium]|nr:NfeD family protein [Elusimicrobiaceae bacterium]